jgi:protein-tyrosine-phosphatase/N-acetylglutamate synthase-like GNAT family acetyltransferase
MKKGILFLCVANSARSQMAEALAREALGPLVPVLSAGSKPSTVNPYALEVLAEIGIDASAHTSKSVETIDPATIGTVITLCAEEVCPVFLGAARRWHWPLPDPASAQPLPRDTMLQRFRAARDAIVKRLDAFRICPLEAGDVSSATTLLQSADLPTAGLNDQFPHGYAGIRDQGQLVAMAGIEVYGQHGLLRSVAVADSHRGLGHGQRLVDERLAWARTTGLQSVSLLTITAAAFFPQFGFEPTSGSEAPAAIQQSVEFASACPASASFLRRKLH